MHSLSLARLYIVQKSRAIQVWSHHTSNMDSVDEPREQRPLMTTASVFEMTEPSKKPGFQESPAWESGNHTTSAYAAVRNSNDDSAVINNDGPGHGVPGQFRRANTDPMVILTDIVPIIVSLGFFVFAFLVLQMNGKETNDASAGRYRNAITIVCASIPRQQQLNMLTRGNIAGDAFSNNVRRHHRSSHVAGRPLEARKGCNHRRA